MLVFLGKTDKGILKVYDHGNDFQCLVSGAVKYPELWHTHHTTIDSNKSLSQAVDACLGSNNIQLIDAIKRTSY